MRLLILLIIFLSNDCISQCGKVIKVYDGDTFTIILEGNLKLKVRLAYIDCPEHDQAFGIEAKSYASNILLNSKVCIDIRYYDPYKRAVSWVKLPSGKALNEELLKMGLAWHFVKFSKDKNLAELEKNAKIHHIGLWKSPVQQAPWDFRKQHKRGFIK
ncbi:MAG: thermonuclease family protein [Opitutaceae bacterium]|nr:thermonuclease family protein [Cytophagales bacterium]